MLATSLASNGGTTAYTCKCVYALRIPRSRADARKNGVGDKSLYLQNLRLGVSAFISYPVIQVHTSATGPTTRSERPRLLSLPRLAAPFTVAPLGSTAGDLASVRAFLSD